MANRDWRSEKANWAMGTRSPKWGPWDFPVTLEKAMQSRTRLRRCKLKPVRYNKSIIRSAGRSKRKFWRRPLGRWGRHAGSPKGAEFVPEDFPAEARWMSVTRPRRWRKRAIRKGSCNTQDSLIFGEEKQHHHSFEERRSNTSLRDGLMASYFAAFFAGVFTGHERHRLGHLAFVRPSWPKTHRCGAEGRARHRRDRGVWRYRQSIIRDNTHSDLGLFGSRWFSSLVFFTLLWVSCDAGDSRPRFLQGRPRGVTCPWPGLSSSSSSWASVIVPPSQPSRQPARAVRRDSPPLTISMFIWCSQRGCSKSAQWAAIRSPDARLEAGQCGQSSCRHVFSV